MAAGGSARPSLLAFAGALGEDLRSGARAPLSDLWQAGAPPLALVFLRRLG